MVSLASGPMAPPPTPLPKRPTLGLKRDSSYIDTDDENGLSCATKRLKVAFSPNVDIRIVDDWSEKSFDLIKEEVRTAVERHLASHDRRDDSYYISLLQLLNQDARASDAPGGKILKKYLLALEGRVNMLGECGKLVMAVLDLAWLGRDESFVAMYVKLLCSLATAHAKFVPSIMDRLIAYFTKLPAWMGRLAEEVHVSRATMVARVHLTIKTIVRHIPSATSALVRALKFEFPNELATSRSYLQYQRHLLRIIEEVPELRAEVLALLIQRLVNVDVEIQQDLEDLEDETEERVLQRPERLDTHGDSDDSDFDSMSESEVTTTEDEQRMREIRLKVAKMDGTLDLLFEYYTPLIQGGLRPDINDAYQQLLSHFQNFILPNRTRHAQFLLFHFSQLTTDHTAAFAKRCLEIALQVGSVNQRLAACAYMSSFIARGAHVSRDSVRDVFGILCSFLDEMRGRYEPSCRGPDRRSFSMYYAVAQALLYIFCFRWRDLVTGSAFPEPGDDELNEDDILAEGRELAWFADIKTTMHKNIYSSLNPLKVCSPAIVGEFAKIAHHLRFMYIFPKLETNRRVRLGNLAAIYAAGAIADVGRRETAIDRKTGEAHLQLEAYFPFDPYHLPVSKRWIEGDYNEWKLPAGMRVDEDNDESEDDEQSEDESDVDDDDDNDDDGYPEEAAIPDLTDDISVSS